jgi:hypothetical protein
MWNIIGALLIGFVWLLGRIVVWTALGCWFVFRFATDPEFRGNVKRHWSAPSEGSRDTTTPKQRLNAWLARTNLDYPMRRRQARKAKAQGLDSPAKAPVANPAPSLDYPANAPAVDPFYEYERKAKARAKAGQWT